MLSDIPGLKHACTPNEIAGPMRRLILGCIALALWIAAAIAQPEPTRTVYEIDTGASDVRVQVDRAGLFSFLGHSHEVRAPVASGAVELVQPDLSRSTVRVVFDASSLRVTGKGEPAEDVPEVQRTMESERVLDVATFPRIAFDSQKIEIVEWNGNRFELDVTGNLMLHGVTRSQHALVSVVLIGDRLTARGTLVVRQTEFGIDPVTAGAGTVRVKDAVRVTFTLAAGAKR